MCTTRQDVYRISDFLRSFKTDFEQVYSTNLQFRLVVCDYSWATMHSIVEALNNQLMENYAVKVWKLSRYEINIRDEKSMSWICSCVAHTMKRFVRRINSIIKDKIIITFATYCFSLLVNCLDLDTITSYFKLICIVFLSKTITIETKEKLDALEELLTERPIDKKEIKMIISKCNLSIVDTDNGAIIKEKPKEKRKKPPATIKEKSPFTEHFRNIYSKIQNDINNKIDTDEQNIYYYPKFIDCLVESYLPYCFIWSGFVLRDLNNENIRTRYTNSALESEIGSRKAMGSYHLNLLPAQYASHSYKLVQGQCIEFLNSKKEIEIIEEESPLESSLDEENRLEAKENWSKHNRLAYTHLPITSNKIGKFQQNVNFATINKITKKYKISKANKVKRLKKISEKRKRKVKNTEMVDNSNLDEMVNNSHSDEMVDNSHVETDSRLSQVVKPILILKKTKINLPKVIPITFHPNIISTTNEFFDSTHTSTTTKHENILSNITTSFNKQSTLPKYNKLLKISTDSYTHVKIGDFRVTVKNMRDLKDGGWLNDNVILKN